MATPRYDPPLAVPLHILLFDAHNFVDAQITNLSASDYDSDHDFCYRSHRLPDPPSCLAPLAPSAGAPLGSCAAFVDDSVTSSLCPAGDDAPLVGSSFNSYEMESSVAVPLEIAPDVIMVVWNYIVPSDVVVAPAPLLAAPFADSVLAIHMCNSVAGSVSRTDLPSSADLSAIVLEVVAARSAVLLE